MGPLSLQFCFGLSWVYVVVIHAILFIDMKSQAKKKKKNLTIDHRGYLYTLHDKDDVWAKFLSESLQGLMNIMD